MSDNTELFTGDEECCGKKKRDRLRVCGRGISYILCGRVWTSLYLGGDQKLELFSD